MACISSMRIFILLVPCKAHCPSFPCLDSNVSEVPTFLQKCSTTPACERLVIAAEFEQVPWGPQVFWEGKALENEQADVLLEVSDA